MELTKLKKIHEEVKNHPFRLGDKKEWKSYYTLLKELDKEFCECIEEQFKDDEYNGWSFFIHEVRGAIFHFNFEFNEDKFQGEYGRKSCTKEEGEEDKDLYGVVIPEFQKKIVIILENYIQQIHKFIITGKFEEYITYYMGGKNCYEDIQSNGKSRWNKYKLNKEENKFEWVGKLN